MMLVMITIYSSINCCIIENELSVTVLLVTNLDSSLAGYGEITQQRNQSWNDYSLTDVSSQMININNVRVIPMHSTTNAS